MAVSKNKSINDLNGKLGKMVIYELYGKMVARAMPVRKKKTSSPDLLAYQSRFSKSQHLMQAMIPFIRLGFSGYAEEHPAFQEAMSVNLKQDIFSLTVGEEADYSQCILSKGELLGTDLVQAQWEGLDKIKVTWDTQPGDGGLPTDQVMLLFYCPARNESLILKDAADRSAGTITVELPPHLADESLESFVSFMNPDLMMTGMNRKGISNSQYMGRLVK